MGKGKGGPDHWVAVIKPGRVLYELDGVPEDLRTGVEDTFYLPNGEKTSGNGQLIEALVACAREAGREIASPEEARTILGC
jgi:hypothetical protein